MNGTEDVALKTPPASPLPAIFDLTKFLSGSKTGVGETGTSATQGQTAPLEQLIATLSDPNNLAALVGQLFNTGAAQVPGLTTQFANATGTRASHNTMLGQSLATLNTTLAQQLAQAVVQQQQTAVQGAGKLAETNKTVNSSGNKTQTTKPADMKTALGAPLVSVLAGHLLNKIGKANPPQTTTNPPPPAPSTNPPMTDLSTAPGPNFDVGVGADTVTQNAANVGNFDIGLGANASADASVAAAPTDTGDASVAEGVAADNAGDSGFNLDNFDFSDMNFDVGFADGGIILKPRMGPVILPQKSTADGIVMPRMADGGAVPLRRNTPYMGNPTGVAGTPAISTPSAGVGAPTGKPMGLSEMLQALVQGGSKTGSVEDGAGSGGTSTNSSESAGQAPSGISGVTGLAGHALGIGPIAGPIGIGMIVGLMVAAANNQLGLDVDLTPGPPPASTEDSATGQGSSGNNGGNGESAGEGSEGGNSAANAAAAAAAAAANATGTDDAGNGPGSSNGPGGTGNDSSQGGNEGGGGDDGSDGSSGDGGGDGGAAGEADGGPIRARSRKQTRGIDKVPIMATPDEYMLPVDTATFIGHDVLDDIVSLTHIPLRGGR